MKTLSGVFLKPLGISVSAEDYSNQSLAAGQVTRAPAAALADQPLLCEYSAMFSSGKGNPIVPNSDSSLVPGSESLCLAPFGHCQQYMS